MGPVRLLLVFLFLVPSVTATVVVQDGMGDHGSQDLNGDLSWLEFRDTEQGLAVVLGTHGTVAGQSPLPPQGTYASVFHFQIEDPEGMVAFRIEADGSGFRLFRFDEDISGKATAQGTFVPYAYTLHVDAEGLMIGRDLEPGAVVQGSVAYLNGTSALGSSEDRAPDEGTSRPHVYAAQPSTGPGQSTPDGHDPGNEEPEEAKPDKKSPLPVVAVLAALWVAARGRREEGSDQMT